MSLTDILPSDVAEISLLYLPLPELLALERADEKVAHILSRPSFWRRRLIDEYELPPAEVAHIADPRNTYYAHYVYDAAQDGYLFEVGQLLLPLSDEIAEVLAEVRNREDYKVGRFCALYESHPTTGMSTLPRKVIQFSCALHRGDEKALQAEKDKGADVKDYVRFHPLSMEMIDNLLRYKFASPSYILMSLIKRKTRKDFILLAYFLEEYHDLLTTKDCTTAFRYLQRPSKRRGEVVNNEFSEAAQKLLLDICDVPIEAEEDEW